MAKQFKRLLITGAAGALGTVLRNNLRDYADILRLSDINAMGKAAPHEEIVQCDLADFDAVLSMVKDVDMIIHFGGIPVESDFHSIVHSNIVGSHNIYEAARKQGVKRVIYASSNHAIGFYKSTEVIDTEAMHRPDSFYGLSKCFVEDLGSYYYDKFKIESVNIRIGSCYAEPTDRRMLATWLSFDDLTQLIVKSLTTPRVGFAVIYGASNNDQQYWDNSKASFLGYAPKDNAGHYREIVLAKLPDTDPDHALYKFQGGNFAAAMPDDK
ncbi:NAD(P)-dependent oxidoreductase [Entomomonas moraniae]|uniref:NAD(P)-dependent oxidoreductase n=1 Tax=Entomomonas moraniae TaxID=2213226 RepID=A0A3S9XB29_9GAMM|nr:NAD(P)-dependent oxidoreductase [Entomomonas moraniae]AZS49654.1 NAD(P)-dependent oxidoreductase [Entomomonas moraniae]